MGECVHGTGRIPGRRGVAVQAAGMVLRCLSITLRQLPPFGVGCFSLGYVGFGVRVAWKGNDRRYSETVLETRHRADPLPGFEFN